jgi:hypothetical protein
MISTRCAALQVGALRGVRAAVQRVRALQAGVPARARVRRLQRRRHRAPHAHAVGGCVQAEFSLSITLESAWFQPFMEPIK